MATENTPEKNPTEKSSEKIKTEKRAVVKCINMYIKYD